MSVFLNIFCTALFEHLRCKNGVNMWNGYFPNRLNKQTFNSLVLECQIKHSEYGGINTVRHMRMTSIQFVAKKWHYYIEGSTDMGIIFKHLL